VDDAIVVGENIFRKREQGLKPLEAAIKGCQEVGGPVVFSVLTTVAAFAPLLSGSGMMGKIMRHIPWVVILVLLGSLLESLFVLPAHLAHSKAGAKKKVKRTAAWLKNVIDGPYTRLLNFCLGWRYATVALGVAVLLIFVGTFAGGYIKFTLFPKVESDFIIASLTMPAGTPIVARPGGFATASKWLSS
jgi:multidrug efflux pump subunit AcrB